MTTVSVVGCAIGGTCRHAADIKIISRHKSEPSFDAIAFILPSLTEYNPRAQQSISEWGHLRDLQLADDDPTGRIP